VSIKMSAKDRDLHFMKTSAYIYLTSLKKSQFRAVTGFHIFVNFVLGVCILLRVGDQVMGDFIRLRNVNIV
jgi:hypothetical protein